MHIKRTVVAELVFPYAVSIFNTNQGRRVVIGTETRGDCISINPDDLTREVIWRNMGGTMNVCQINPEGEFFAVQEFFKGMASRTACLVKVTRQGGDWAVERFFDLPFVHRTCVVTVDSAMFIVASTVARDKKNMGDWSLPGSTYVMRLPADLSGPGELKPVIPALFKNHGMWKGRNQGRDVILVSGAEGVYEISVPSTPDGDWPAELIIRREVSDMVLFDIDSDGMDELIVIEKFHGSRLVVYKQELYGWREFYSYPINFGHVVWAGSLLGKPSIIVGYRGDNAALVLLRPDGIKDFRLQMKPTIIDEHEGPTNIDILEENGTARIFSCSGAKNRVMMYELGE